MAFRPEGAPCSLQEATWHWLLCQQGQWQEPLEQDGKRILDGPLDVSRAVLWTRKTLVVVSRLCPKAGLAVHVI